MPERIIRMSPKADLAGLRAKFSDPAFAAEFAKDPETQLKKFGVEVDAHTAKSISDHLNVLPKGTNPAALAVSVVVSAVL